MIAQTDPESFAFRVDTKLSSLENYRGRGGGSSRKRAADRQYVRILKDKELIGWRCRQAARPGQLARIFGQPVSIEVGLYRQDIDCDNVKLVVDALKHIVYPDDKKQFVRRVCAEHGDDEVFEEPTVIVRVEVME
jgi:hypothetical protein